jgi:hypothetical protein
MQDSRPAPQKNADPSERQTAAADVARMAHDTANLNALSRAMNAVAELKRDTPMHVTMDFELHRILGNFGLRLVTPHPPLTKQDAMKQRWVAKGKITLTVWLHMNEKPAMCYANIDRFSKAVSAAYREAHYGDAYPAKIAGHNVYAPEDHELIDAVYRRKFDMRGMTI